MSSDIHIDWKFFLSSLPIEKLDKGVSYLSRANKAISVALRLAGDSIAIVVTSFFRF